MGPMGAWTNLCHRLHACLINFSHHLYTCIIILNSTDILPVEYGGMNGCLDDLTKFWKKEVEASQDWLKLQVQNIPIMVVLFANVMKYIH